MNYLTFDSARMLFSFFFNDHRSDLSESFLTFSFGQSPRIDSLKNAGDFFKTSVYDFSDTPDFSEAASESVFHQETKRFNLSGVSGKLAFENDPVSE